MSSSRRGWPLVCSFGVGSGVGRFLMFLLLFVNVKDIATRGTEVANAMGSGAKRTIVNTGVGMGSDANNAVASVSKRFGVRTSSGTALMMSFVKCVARRMPLGNEAGMMMALSRSSRALSRIIMINCKARGGMGLANSITTMGISRGVTDHSVAGMSSDLSNLIPKLMIDRAANFTNKSNTSLGMHNLNSVGGSSPLVMISKVPSMSVGHVGVGSVRDVSILGSTTSSTICNSHTTGNIVLVAAGNNSGRTGSGIACGNSCTLSDPMRFCSCLTSCDHTLAVRVHSTTANGGSADFRRNAMRR